MPRSRIAQRTVFLVLALTVCLATLATWAQGAKPLPQKYAEQISRALVSQTDPGNPEVRVWVNTVTGVYHCPGSRWYGKTKRGEYMSQAEAQKKGYRPAYGKVCR